MPSTVCAQRRARLTTTFFATLCLAVTLGVGVLPHASAAPSTRSGTAGVRVGEPAPALSLERLAGIDEVGLDALRGRVVLLDFWATWCGPCRAVMPRLSQLQQRTRQRGLTVIGVSRESSRTIQSFLARRPVTYTVARDLLGGHAAYGVQVLPTLVVIDRRGVTRLVHAGGDLGLVLPLVEQLLREPAP